MTDLDRRARFVAGTGLALVFAVVLVSAAIRLGQAPPPLDVGALMTLRVLHRVAASLEVIAALWLGWFAWHARAARPMLARGIALAVAITLGLSVLGIVAGREPPPAAAAGNLLGGLALAAAFAWTVGVLHESAVRMANFVTRFGAVLLVVQCLLGARLAVFPAAASSPALPAHGILGIVLASGAALLALRSEHRHRRTVGIALAILVPLAGFTALQYESSSIAAFAHAMVVALLVVGASYTRLRPA